MFNGITSVHLCISKTNVLSTITFTVPVVAIYTYIFLTCGMKWFFPTTITIVLLLPYTCLALEI